MSRCFPYPPPGYCRNGAAHEALIESIKLQKETDKAKAERKKEKKLKKEKKEKKKEEKEKRKNDEKLKSQKNQNQDLQNMLQKEAQINGKKPNTEALEKSDLTEENGQPIKPCYSSDSTQNSNKRRRDDNNNNVDDDDDVLLPDDSSNHGTHFKIRLLKKQKGSTDEDARLKTVPLAPSRRDNNAAQWVPSTQTMSNGLHLGSQPSPVSSSSSAKPILPPGSRKSDVEPLKSSRQQHQQKQISSFARPVVSQSQLKHDIPISSVSRNIASNLKPVIPDPVLNKPSPITAGKRPINEIPIPSNISLLNKPSPISKGKRPVNETPVPGTSRPTKPGKRKEGPTRSEKKMMKKQAKYEKLIQSWVPPVFQALIPQVVNDDEDWLSRKTKPANSSNFRGEVETCDVGATGLLHPRARFLAEAGIHALPYTVPY